MKNLIIIAVIFIVGVASFFLARPVTNKTINSGQSKVQSVVETGVKTNAGNIGKTFTLEDVAAHNTKDSCYLAVDGKVYDVSPFIALGMHKAGVDVIINNCGKDATVAFTKAHEGKSLPTETLAKYYIGMLK